MSNPNFQSLGMFGDGQTISDQNFVRAHLQARAAFESALQIRLCAIDRAIAAKCDPDVDTLLSWAKKIEAYLTQGAVT
jgi:hypothetical protein